MKNTRAAQVRQKTMKVFISLYDRRETAMLSTKSDKHKKNPVEAIRLCYPPDEIINDPNVSKRFT